MSDCPTFIDVDEAQWIVRRHANPLEEVDVPLGEALGRTLAAPVACDIDYPPFDRSLMDGYAVRAADVAGAPVALRVVGQVPAGTVVDRPLAAGEAMQINTGAPLPPGADAVVRVEHTRLGEGGASVVVLRAVEAGKFITPRGSYVSAGQTVLTRGTRVTPLEVAAAASAGAARVTVYRRPRVAILATGDELIDIDQRPTGGQIRDSNQCLLEALVRKASAEPVVLAVAGDEREVLRARIEQGLEADVLCITGGVSMGAFDFVPEVLGQCGVTLHFRKLAIKPGRPVMFGTALSGALVFALPGNPVSAFVCFVLLVAPALETLTGGKGAGSPLVRATLRGRLDATTDRRSYRPARTRVTADGLLEAEPLSWGGSGDPFGVAMADALTVQPPGSPAVQDGQPVMIHLLERL